MLERTIDTLLRDDLFTPYVGDQPNGMPLPVFRLRIWETNEVAPTGQERVQYELVMLDNDGTGTVIFDGADVGISPMHAIDSDEAVRAVMAFLTLRPGDTDDEYFTRYTELQRDFVEYHAEALSLAVQDELG